MGSKCGFAAPRFGGADNRMPESSGTMPVIVFQSVVGAPGHPAIVGLTGRPKVAVPVEIEEVCVSESVGYCGRSTEAWLGIMVMTPVCQLGRVSVENAPVIVGWGKESV